MSEFNFDLLKKNLNSNSEELVTVTEDNIGQVLKKDKVLACLCQALEVVPTFTSFTSAKGKEFIVLSNACVTEISNKLTE